MSRYMLYTNYYGCEEYYPVDTLESGLVWAKDFLINWINEEQSKWVRQNGEFILNRTDRENWNFMIENCEVYVVDLNRMQNIKLSDHSTEEYDYTDGHYYYPFKKAEQLGWAEMKLV